MSFTACNARLRCANQGIVRILLLPGANAPNVHKCTFAIYGEKNLKNDIYGMPGVKGQTLGDPGARPSTTDTVCLIWTKGQRSKSVPEPAPHLLLSCPCRFDITKCHIPTCCALRTNTKAAIFENGSDVGRVY